MDAYARDVALYEMHKLESPDINDLNRVDPGWLVDVDTLIDSHWPYRQHQQLPDSGGTRDQDPDLMTSLKWLDWQVEWHKMNEKKSNNLPDFDDWQKNRRELHQKRG